MYVYYTQYDIYLYKIYFKKYYNQAQLYKYKLF